MAHRKNHSRKNKNRLNKTRRHRGGMAPVGDSSMLEGQKDNLAQGNQYLNIHKGQYGGAAPYPTAVTDSPLTGSMVASARTGPLDVAMSQIRGMQDGGRRKVNKNKKNKNKSKKNKNKKNKNKSRKNKQRRNHRGGSNSLTGSPLSENSMLLPSGLEKQAALNYDWSAARDPNYWAPK